MQNIQTFCHIHWRYSSTHHLRIAMTDITTMVLIAE